MTTPIVGIEVPTFPPVPTVTQLSDWSGRPEASYTPFANTALFRSVMKFVILTEILIDDWNGLASPDAALATVGILAYADNLYLAQPYQQVMANPFQSEHVGSYNYSKTMQGGGSFSRLVAPAMELKMETTGVDEFDMAVRYLAHRTRTGGVFFGGISVFEDGSMRYDGVELMIDNETGRVLLFGPQDHDQLDFPSMFDINSEMFPQDPS